MLWKIGTVQAEELRLRVCCVRCRVPQELTLSGLYEDARSARIRCRKCTTILDFSFRPCIMHQGNSILGHIDTSADAGVLDLVSLALRVSCMGCSDVYTLSKVTRRARVEKSCFECHEKMAFQAQSFQITVLDGNAVTAAYGPGATRSGGSKKTKNRHQPEIVEGQPLPKNGACDHYSKSLRWLRFPCCGVAYPCVLCHQLSDCPHENTLANRMICGKCSREQNDSSKPCAFCGFHMGRKNIAHWEGGQGARNTAALSKKDSRKNKGVSRSGVKKTQSAKAQRVGQAGKKTK
eukprot:m.80095 g.80095  ORF g.80095 m.80095 type:complete len:292 (-) comp8198_c2_seq1:19-894(-)